MTVQAVHRSAARHLHRAVILEAQHVAVDAVTAPGRSRRCRGRSSLRQLHTHPPFLDRLLTRGTERAPSEQTVNVPPLVMISRWRTCGGLLVDAATTRPDHTRSGPQCGLTPKQIALLSAGAWQLLARRVRGLICTLYVGAGRARSGSGWRRAGRGVTRHCGPAPRSQARGGPRHRGGLAARAPQTPRWRGRSSVGRAVRVRPHDLPIGPDDNRPPGHSSTCRVASPSGSWARPSTMRCDDGSSASTTCAEPRADSGSASGRSMRKVHAALALRIAGYDPLEATSRTAPFGRSPPRACPSRASSTRSSSTGSLVT